MQNSQPSAIGYVLASIPKTGIVLWLLAVFATAMAISKVRPQLLDSGRTLARLAKAKGTVEFRTSDIVIWFPVSSGRTLGPGDMLATGAGANATVEFNNGTMLSLGERSQIVVSEPEVKAGGSEFVVTLVRGTVDVKQSTAPPPTKKSALAKGLAALTSDDPIAAFRADNPLEALTSLPGTAPSAAGRGVGMELRAGKEVFRAAGQTSRIVVSHGGEGKKAELVGATGSVTVQDDGGKQRTIAQPPPPLPVADITAAAAAAEPVPLERLTVAVAKASNTAMVSLRALETPRESEFPELSTFGASSLVLARMPTRPLPPLQIAAAPRSGSELPREWRTLLTVKGENIERQYVANSGEARFSLDTNLFIPGELGGSTDVPLKLDVGLRSSTSGNDKPYMSGEPQEIRLRLVGAGGPFAVTVNGLRRGNVGGGTWFPARVVTEEDLAGPGAYTIYAHSAALWPRIATLASGSSGGFAVSGSKPDDGAIVMRDGRPLITVKAQHVSAADLKFLMNLVDGDVAFAAGAAAFVSLPEDLARKTKIVATALDRSGKVTLFLESGPITVKSFILVQEPSLFRAIVEHAKSFIPGEPTLAH